MGLSPVRERGMQEWIYMHGLQVFDMHEHQGLEYGLQGFNEHGLQGFHDHGLPCFNEHAWA